MTSSLLQVSSWATSVSSISIEILVEESTPPQFLHSAGLQEAPHGNCQGLQLAPSGVVGWVSPGPIWTAAGILRTYTSGTSRQGDFSVPWRPSHSEPVIGSLEDFFKPSVGEGVVWSVFHCVCAGVGAPGLKHAGYVLYHWAQSWPLFRCFDEWHLAGSLLASRVSLSWPHPWYSLSNRFSTHIARLGFPSVSALLLR